MKKNLVIIGAGMASGRLLEHLTDAQGADWDVTLFNAEPRGNYNRIMLSPVLSGDKTYDEIVTHDDDWYAERGVTCRFGERVAGIDRAAKIVRAPNGDVAYDKLVLGTGSVAGGIARERIAEHSQVRRKSDTYNGGYAKSA